VHAIGKIWDIFSGRGITEAYPTKNNLDGLEKTKERICKKAPGIIFTNLVDFDMVYGHRRDVSGYANALSEVDAYLPELIGEMHEGDLLFITADHGCDPTFKGTDHTREKVPLIVTWPALSAGEFLGERESFADIGATILDLFGLPKGDLAGVSFASKLLKAAGNGK
jgi:phosphopentomutase